MSTREHASGSMGLLDQIVREAMDPGYAAVRRRKALQDGGPAPVTLTTDRPVRDPSDTTAPGPSGVRGARPRSAVHLGAAVVLGVAGLLGVWALADARAGEPEAAAARSALLARIEAVGSQLDDDQQRVDALRAEVSALRSDALAASKQGRARAERVEALELAAGAVPVVGPGVRVVVDDAPESDLPAGTPDLGKVQDRDLQVVVNGLWAAGAEAVAVNGYRLTATTAIRTAGETVLVDFRPVVPPYSVEAIGDPRSLRAAFADGPGGQTLQVLSSRYGIRFATESVDGLRLGAGVALTAREAREGER